MLIAVTAKSNEPDSDVDPRFARAQCFHLIDSQTGHLTIIENKENQDLMQGAGVQTGQLIASKNVEVLLTGHCGPRAFQILQAAGVKIVTGVEGKVKDAVEKFKQGQYEFTDSPDVQSHWG
jgi:predicted Fe-Mo cluster-binding NifX family protein